MAEQTTDSEYDSQEDSESDHKNGLKEIIKNGDKKALQQKEIRQSTKIEESGKERYFQDYPDESDSSPDPIAEFDKMRELTETIRKKNHNIKNLLFDVEVLSDENEQLKNKLTETKDKLAEATVQIRELSLEITNFKSENTFYIEKIQELENVNVSLKNQIDDLISANNEQDTQMNDFTLQMDSRINDWKELLEAKELEIENLQKKSVEIVINTDIDPNIMTQNIKQHDEEIEFLKTKLGEATEDLTKSIETIEQLNTQKLSLEKLIVELKSNLPSETSKNLKTITQLKTELENVTFEKENIEEVLKMKEIELSESLQKINKYETGELGLKQAITSYKKAKQQVKVRDEHINKLVAENNKHIYYRDQLQLENAIMRTKLNLSPEHPISSDDILSKHARRKEDLERTLKNLADLEEEKISLQIKLGQKNKCLRRLCSYVNDMGLKIPERFISLFLDEEINESQAFETLKNSISKPIVNNNITIEPSNLSDETKHIEEKVESDYYQDKFQLLKENYDNVIEENEIFRKGIQEIVIILKENTKNVSNEITFTCLESFLNILNNRHNTQWYHPTMKILLESKIQNECQEKLRILLNDARKEILVALNLFEAESKKTSQLEKEIDNLKIKNVSEETQPVKITEVTESENDIVKDFTNFKIINETILKPADQKYLSLLNENLKRFHSQFQILNESMIEAFSQYNVEKNQWIKKETEYRDEIEILKMNLQNNINDTQEISETKEKSFLERKLKYMEECVKQSRSQRENILSDFLSYKIDKLKTINNLELLQQKLNFQIIEMHNTLRNTIPIEMFLKQNTLLNETQLKYRDILNKQLKNIESNKNQFVNIDASKEVLMTEITLIKKEKNTLEQLLKDEASKNVILSSGGKSDDNFKDVFGQLKNAQIELISTKQKLSYLENMNNVFSTQFDSLQEKLNEFNKILIASEERASVLESNNINLQQQQVILMNKLQDISFSTITNVDSKNEIDTLKIANKKLNNQIDLLTEQIDNFQHTKLINDLEVNMLRHQIVDLQSVSDSKAIISRLSSEILVTHLHTAEMHKKKEKLSINFIKEQEKRKHLEEIIHEKDAQFNDFIVKSNLKINFLSTALQTLRNQYQGSLPLTILENIVNTKKELNVALQEFKKQKEDFDKNKDDTVNSLMSEKYEEFISKNKNVCTIGEVTQCSHFIQLKVNESKWSREKKILKDNVDVFKKIQYELEMKIESLEESLLMLSFALGNNLTANDLSLLESKDKNSLKRATSVIEISDMDDYNNLDVPDKIPIPKPRKIVKELPVDISIPIENLPGSPTRNSTNISINQNLERKKSAIIQTEHFQNHNSTQTDFVDTNTKISNIQIMNTEDKEISQLKRQLNDFENEVKSNLNTINKLTIELEEQKVKIENDKTYYLKTLEEKDIVIEQVRMELKNKNIEYKIKYDADEKDEVESLKKLLEELKVIESKQNDVIEQFKLKLEKEKKEHKKSNVEAQKQIIETKMNMNSLEKELNKLKTLLADTNFTDAKIASNDSKRGRILELEAKCFQLQKDFDDEHSNMLSLRSECERWKNLAAERFANMEMLSKRLEEKHSHEVVSYKTETNHWLSELADAKHLISTLKVQINDQNSSAIKQIAEKDSYVHQLEKSNYMLKQQVLNLQMAIASADPSFDVSDLIEMEEMASANNSGENVPKDKDVIDHEDTSNDSVNFKEIKRRNWSESVIERIRKEKYMLGKQNSLLRKQVQILSARERRCKLELQNVKSQMCRMSSIDNSKIFHNGSDFEHLHKKIESLEQQLSEKSLNESPGVILKAKQLALWDKQKRWQETADRWKNKYEEKCHQLDKAEKLYEAAKTTLHRLEKEKRSLDSRLSKYSRVSDGPTPSTVTGDCDNHLEMLLQDKERLEEEVRSLKRQLEECPNKNSLLEKIESQQRRITAFEIAEKGKSLLVNEYEKLLEQNALLSKQNLKLESEILELQLQIVGKRFDPEGSEGEANCCKRLKKQNEHLESYMQLLKEENSKLIAKNVTSDVLDQQLTKVGTSSQNKRIADLERTILTLRGLVSGLQAENKKILHYNTNYRKCSVSTSNDKYPEELKYEINNLKSTIKEKDNLLEKAKNLLRRAAEKEKELVKEISSLKEKV